MLSQPHLTLRGNSQLVDQVRVDRIQLFQQKFSSCSLVFKLRISVANRHKQLQKADFTMHEVPNSFPDHCMTCTWISSRKTFSWQLHNPTTELESPDSSYRTVPSSLFHIAISLSVYAISPSPGWTASCSLDSLPCSNTSKKKKYYHPRSTNNTQHS